MEGIDELARLSHDEIDLLIAGFLVDEDFGSREDDEEERRFIARRWFSALNGRLRSAICGNPAVKKAMENPGDNNQLLAAAILDALLSSRLNVGVPVTVLAVKVAYVGVGKICGTD